MQSGVKENIEYFLKKKSYIIPIIIVAILSYGFIITHYSINIDTLSDNRYFEEGTLIGQGRIAAPLINKLFHVIEFNPFFTDTIAVIVLIIATIMFCILFKKILDTKLNILSCTIFSCIFISYPLINEIFVYTPASLLIALGFLLISVSLNIMYEYLNKRDIKKIIIASILLFFAISLYESFATVYLCGIFLIFILEYAINKPCEIKIKQLLKKFIIYLIPMILAIVLFVIIPNIVMNVLNIEKNEFAAKGILYKNLGFIEAIKNLKRTLLILYFVNGLFYLPITVFIISVIIYSVICIVLAIKNRKLSILFLFLGGILSSIALSLLQGVASPYRTCQVFTLFCAFTFMLLTNIIMNSNVKKYLKTILITIIFIIIFYQARNLHTIFYINYARYEEEKSVLINIGNELKNNYNTEKSVIFVGKYELSSFLKEKIYIDKDSYKIKIAKKIMNIFNENAEVFESDYKYIQTNINSYLNWGIDAFGEPNTEIFKWLNMLGYDFNQGNMQMLNEAKQYIKNTEQTNNRTIIDMENYIIVNI